jgi:hypothetical protein
MSAITMVCPRFSIRGERGGTISIEAYRYERPDTGDFWDSNWLECVAE